MFKWKVSLTSRGSKKADKLNNAKLAAAAAAAAGAADATESPPAHQEGVDNEWVALFKQHFIFSQPFMQIYNFFFLILISIHFFRKKNPILRNLKKLADFLSFMLILC